MRFTDLLTQMDRTSRESKTAVDAALQAAKEAVGEQNRSNALAISKSEVTFTKQIDQIGFTLSSIQKSIDDKIDDIKVRFNAIEIRVNGIEGQKRGGNEVWAIWFAVTGIVVAVFGAVISCVVVFRH